jgi:S-DNA-T family DNA segregation ATPase FtsK/SpoIIIE
MSRKDASESHHGWADVIGVVLLATALVLALAQWTFDKYDLSYVRLPPNSPPHNLIGPFGAHFAHGFFYIFGVTAYIVPLILCAFGVAYLFGFLSYLRERIKWSLLWTTLLLVSVTGLLHLTSGWSLMKRLHEHIHAASAGGFLGAITYGQGSTYEWGLSLAGSVGASIIYAALCCVSVLILTNFRLGEWLQARFDGEELPVA